MRNPDAIDALMEALFSVPDLAFEATCENGEVTIRCPSQGVSMTGPADTVPMLINDLREANRFLPVDPADNPVDANLERLAAAMEKALPPKH